MGDAIPVMVQRGLADKLYEKRKIAALEGGLLGLAAVTVGLATTAPQHLDVDKKCMNLDGSWLFPFPKDNSGHVRLITSVYY
ncbi:uncharacterized protein A4U43_C07F37460 [Asparagus officinalis]|uniref:Uncharacterized protein n=1 Tax=Asparagus officinalis TaxID=4686 RepID=A0A5P1EHV5_ASPOF|nr:uncharacterized protein A4U43_C07F37460 [Asparagus officinalis]